MAVDLNQLAADDATYNKQAADQQAAQKVQEAQAKQPPSLLERWAAPVGRVTMQMLDAQMSEAEQWGTAVQRVGQDVAAGAVTAAVNTADAVGFVANKMADAMDPMPAPLPPSPIWSHVKGAILDFRDALAVKDPNIVDNLTQASAQLMIPFMGYSRMLSGIHGLANVAAAGVATDLTALAPHDPRMADMIALGHHTEGKFGDALRALAPDGSAVNAYVNYLADRGDESETEGRFKNVLDGFGVNMIATPVLATVGSVLKQGTAGLRYAAENGVRNTISDLFPTGPVASGAKAQRGSVGVQNNASGESAASIEAQNWVKAHEASGVKRYRLDPDGKPMAMKGIEARDPQPLTGQPVIDIGPDGKHELIDRGNMTKMQADGLAERAKALHGFGPKEEKSGA